MIDGDWTKYRIDGCRLSNRIFNHNDHRDRKLASFLSEIIDQFVDEDKLLNQVINSFID